MSVKASGTDYRHRKWFIILQNKTLREQYWHQDSSGAAQREGHFSSHLERKKESWFLPWVQGPTEHRQVEWGMCNWDSLSLSVRWAAYIYLDFWAWCFQDQVSSIFRSSFLISSLKGQCLLKIFLQNFPESVLCFYLKGWLVKINTLLLSCPKSRVQSERAQPDPLIISNHSFPASLLKASCENIELLDQNQNLSYITNLLNC